MFTNPNNKLVGYKLSEQATGYARVLQCHTAYILRLVATYLGYMVNLYNNNVSGAFLQLNHHPDIAPGNISLQGNKIIVFVALHFGGNYDPTSWEPISRAECFLA